MPDPPATPLRLHTRDLGGALWPDPDPFRPLEPECRRLQFAADLTEAQLQRAGELIAGRSDVTLRIYCAALPDLELLRHFPGLTRLDVEVHGLGTLNGLEHVADGLEAFALGKTRKRFPMRVLADLPRLTSLHLEGHTPGTEHFARLADLTALSLRGVTLPDLGALEPLRQLRELTLRLGGTVDLRLLPSIGRLEALDLMRLTGLDDLSMLADLTGLRKLRLDWLRNVTDLPSFAPLAQLTHVWLDTLKGLKRLEPVAEAPALEYLQVVSAPQLTPEHFRCLAGHPSLRTLDAAPAGWTAYRAIKAMLPGVAR